jgi:adenylate cyclase class IV
MFMLHQENEKGKEAWLIFYDRPDTDGPKLSTYNKCFLGTSGQELRAVLAAAQGERLVVEKTRHLFMVGQTRIHIDEVKGLGSFMELEVLLILISYYILYGIFL